MPPEIDKEVSSTPTNEAASPPATAPESTPAEPTSVRDALERAFEQEAQKGADNKPSGQEARPTPTPAPVDDKSMEAKGGKEPPAGAADGKTGSASEDAPVEPPVRWTKEEKEAWVNMTKDLAPEAAKEVRRIQSILANRNKGMEAAFTKSMTEIANVRAQQKEIDEILGPRREAWRQRGFSDKDALQGILEGFEHSMRDPVGFVSFLLEQRGINPVDYANQVIRQRGGQPQTQTPQDDASGVQLHPEVKRLLDQTRAENQELRRQLEGIGQRVQGVTETWQQQQARQQQEMQRSVQEELSSFMSAVDDKGEAKHPFYAEVRNEMATMLTSGLASSLEDAYDQAVYARPDLRQRMIESREIQIRREYEQRLRDDAAKAKAAGAGVRGAGAAVAINNSSQQAPKTGSIRDMLQDQLEAQMARGRV